MVRLGPLLPLWPREPEFELEELLDFELPEFLEPDPDDPALLALEPEPLLLPDPYPALDPDPDPDPEPDPLCYPDSLFCELDPLTSPLLDELVVQAAFLPFFLTTLTNCFLTQLAPFQLDPSGHWMH